MSGLYADPVVEACYRSRLYYTASGTRVHVAHPSHRGLTLCGLRRGWRVLSRPDDEQVCKKCRAAFDREVGSA